MSLNMKYSPTSPLPLKLNYIEKKWTVNQNTGQNKEFINTFHFYKIKCFSWIRALQNQNHKTVA